MEAAHHTEEGRPREPGRPRENWFDDDYIEFWIEREKARAPERYRQFFMVRALIPKTATETFRYVNLGAGPGNLDEVLLDHYKGAEAVLVDGSMAMLAAARKRLERFEGRVEYVQANLETPDWTGAVEGPFDVAVSTIALHNLRDPRRIRVLYAEINGLIGHGGVFLNLDYVRMARPSLYALATKAGTDPDAGIPAGGHGGANTPGTLEEQLIWLREAGFAIAECPWREFSVAAMMGVHDHLHLAEADHDHGHAEHAEHGHHDHDHDEHHDHDDDHEHGHHEEHAAHGHGEHH